MGKESSKAQPVGFMGKLFRFLILLICVGLIWAIYLISKPQDLTDIDGNTDPGKASRDLQNVLDLAIEGNHSVSLTELEINQLLRNAVVAKQGGVLADAATIKKVLARLKPDVAEVIVVRELFGREFTSSMYLQFEQNETEAGISTRLHLHGDAIGSISSLPKIGGRIGQLSVPQGFLLAVLPDFEKVAAVLAPEIELGFEKMVRFKIEEKRLILDPRRPVKHMESGKPPF